MKSLSIFLAVSALSLALVPAASATSSSSSTQVGDLVSNATFGYGNNRAGGSGAITIDTNHLLTTGAKPPPSSSLFVTTEKGTKLNANIAETCDFTVLTNTGSCPSSTRLGSGQGTIDVRTGGLTQLTTDDVTPYKVANSNCSGLASGVKMCVAVHANEPVTGTVTDIIAALTTSGGRVKLNIPSYSIPEILGIKSVLTAGKFVINKSKTVKSKGKKKKLFIFTNPSKCNKTWTISETRNYEGFGDITNNVKLPCKK